MLTARTGNGTNSVKPGNRKRQYPLAFKVQVVKETQTPGASVSVVARRHDINSNVVFRWRREYREGQLGESTAGPFVPIRVLKDAPVPALPPPPVVTREATARAAVTKTGIIQVTLPGGFALRVEENVDEAALRRVLKILRDLR